MNSLLKYGIISLLFILRTAGSASGQILSDTSALQLIRSGIENIYRLEFDEARDVFSSIGMPAPEHAVSYLLDGLIIYWENYPLLPDTQAADQFESIMRRCIDICEKKPYSEDYEAEALLSNISARGLLLLFFADNQMSRNVIPLASGTYKYIMRSFDFNQVFSDLYYFTGLYNYYRDAYPRIHPVYKAVAALFPPGNMETGLRELNICAQNSILLRAEANSILSWIYTYYENNYSKAVDYTSLLTSSYPQNYYFKGLHIKNLLLLEKYDEAENYLDLSPEGSGNSFYSAQVKVFRGIVQEKKYRDPDSAFILYESAMSELVPFGNFGNEYSAYCCFGLSRIYDAKGDNPAKRHYHRKAVNLSTFKKINFD